MPIIPSILLSAALICGAQTAETDSVKDIFADFGSENWQDYVDSGAFEEILNLIESKSVCEKFAAPAVPTNEPSDDKTAKSDISAKPTAVPTAEPTAIPTSEPTASSAAESTASPAAESTESPTAESTASPTSESEFAAEVVRLVNAERAEEGLSELSTASDLTAAANQRAVEISSVFSHTRPSGSSFSTVLAEYGITYSAAGENIAYGQETPEAVVEAWMNSSGHRANILSSDYSKIGVGIYKSGNTYYWTQLFVD